MAFQIPHLWGFLEHFHYTQECKRIITKERQKGEENLQRNNGEQEIDFDPMNKIIISRKLCEIIAKNIIEIYRVSEK